MTDRYNTRKTLLHKLQNQYDEKAWKDFHDTYYKCIRAILWRMNLKVDDANDVLQSVMLKIWSKLPDFDYENRKGKFRNWLSVVTANTAKNHLRTENRLYACLNGEKSSWLDEYTKATLPPEIEDISSKEWEKFISTMAWENVSDKLTENMKLAFEALLRGDSIKEISTTLEINENTIAQYKKRIKHKMHLEIVRLQNELG